MEKAICVFSYATLAMGDALAVETAQQPRVSLLKREAGCAARGEFAIQRANHVAYRDGEKCMQQPSQQPLQEAEFQRPGHGYAVPQYFSFSSQGLGCPQAVSRVLDSRPPLHAPPHLRYTFQTTQSRARVFVYLSSCNTDQREDWRLSGCYAATPRCGAHESFAGTQSKGSIMLANLKAVHPPSPKLIEFFKV